jgi:hypothetical protein
MKEYPKITFTITTCKRLHLFLNTMASFFENCLDIDLIDRWILSDDHSSISDIQHIKNTYPMFEIYHSPSRGQAHNLNTLFSKVETEWFFHCEDDWDFIQKGHFIRELFDVAYEDHMIKNIVLRHWTGNEIISKDQTFTYNVHKYRPEINDSKIILTTDSKWFGYSLNPGLQHKPTVDKLGLYRENLQIPRYFDRSAAIKYLTLGYKRANLLTKYIEHTGGNISAYNIK